MRQQIILRKYYKGGGEMSRKAFTLIELIVVIAIIAILAAIIAPNAFRAIEKSKTSATIGELQGIKTAALTYFSDVGGFPATCDGAACGTNANGFITGGTISGWDGPYLPKWPPSSKFNGFYNWDNTTNTLIFNAGQARNERYIEVNGTGINDAVKNSMDRSIDGGANVNLGGGELINSTATAVFFLVTRDGTVTPQ
jgi:general secretion pathway protein G